MFWPRSGSGLAEGCYLSDSEMAGVFHKIKQLSYVKSLFSEEILID